MSKIYEATTRIIKKHLSSRNLSKTESNWEISKSKVGGRGVFAKRDLEPGEIIFADYPLILGPRTLYQKLCSVCYKEDNLKKCENRCGLHLCSQDCGWEIHRVDCEKITSWKEGEEEELEGIVVCLSPIRSLFLKDFEREIVKVLVGHKGKHGKEVDLLKERFKLRISGEEEEYMRLVCSVLDANAFEVTTEKSKSLRGLYPLSSLLNHSCSPNVMHVFDKDQNMIVKAAKPIKQGEEIYNSYSRTIWATLSRRIHLLTTKHFACTCPRCQDKTEFQTNLNTILCKCKGIVLPDSPLKFNSDWTCTSCNAVHSENNVKFLLSVINRKISELNVENFEEILEFYKRRMLEIVPECSQACVGFKYAVIWFLGHNEGFRLNEISDEYLNLKEDFCRDILVLADKLRLGACKIRGLVLYELYEILQEKKQRNAKPHPRTIEVNNNVLEEDEMLAESAKVFLFDVTAPKDLQKYWQTNNVDTNWRNYF